MQSLISNVLNAFKFKVIPMKLSLICKDTSLLLLKTNKSINTQAIFSFKTVHMKTAYLPSVMEPILRMIFNLFLQKQSVTSFWGRIKWPFLCSKSMESFPITMSTRVTLPLWRFAETLRRIHLSRITCVILPGLISCSQQRKRMIARSLNWEICIRLRQAFILFSKTIIKPSNNSKALSDSSMSKRQRKCRSTSLRIHRNSKMNGVKYK